VPQIAIFGIKEGDRAIITVPELPVLEISSNVISGLCAAGRLHGPPQGSR
jgi:hypothetical protein